MPIRRLFQVLCILFAAVAGFMPARAQQPSRPLVFIPGILGSKLCDSSGAVVWGERSSLSNFYKLEITGKPSDIKLHPCGTIDEIQMLGRFWSINEYNKLYDALEQAGYKRNENLYVFDYDWRLSNYDNAKLFDAFIKKFIGSREFDILAHSMGGIISRIVMDKYDSTKSLQRIIYLGTPFLGSINTFATLKEGWGFLPNQLAGGQDVVWRVSLSFPGMLELLPRYDDCCYVRTPTGAKVDLKIFEAETWKNRGWLPDAYATPARYEMFKSNLEASGALTPLLKKSAPAPVYEIMFASDSHTTYRRIGMLEEGRGPGAWFFSHDFGDGTVPVYSAARRPDQTDYGNSLPSFAVHATIFDDKWVVNELTRLLKKQSPRDPDPIGGRGKPAFRVNIDGIATNWSVKSSDIELASSVIDAHAPISATLVLRLDDGVSNPRRALFSPKAVLRRDGSNNEIAVAETTTDQDLDNKTLRFIATASDSGVGVGEIVFLVGEDYEPLVPIFAVEK